MASQDDTRKIAHTEAISDRNILDLSTLAPERPKVRIDGELYELVCMDELGLRAQQWIISRSQHLQPFFQAEHELTDEEVDTIALTARQYVSRILEAPADVKEALSDWMRLRLVFWYMQQELESLMIAPVDLEPASTGES